MVVSLPDDAMPFAVHSLNQQRAQFDAYEGFRVVNHDALGTTAIDPIWYARGEDGARCERRF